MSDRGWFTTLWGRLFRREMTPASPSTPHIAGSEFSMEVAATPSYPALQAMSALGAFPLVFSCASIIASALAGRPRQVVRGMGTAARAVEGHPFLELMKKPSERVGGQLFHRQRTIDYLLAGTAYTRILEDRALGARPSLFRLHPARSEIVPRPSGDTSGVSYEHGRAFYPWEDLLIVRGPSWEDTPSGAYGMGWVAVLHEELQTELASMRGAQGMARRGAPSLVIQPAEDKDGRSQTWTSDQHTKVNQLLEKMLSFKNAGGAMSFAHRVDMKPLGFSAVDMQFIEGRKLIAERIMCVARVPPSKLGIRGANYATARAEDVTFWEARVEEAAFFDEEDSRLAERLGKAGDRVVTDFSNVDALQYNRTARQARVRMWKELGIPMAQALAAERFDEIEPPPVEKNAAPQSDPTAGPKDPAPEPQPPGNDDQAGQGRSWWQKLTLDPRRELARKVAQDLYFQACAGKRVRWLAAEGCEEHREMDGTILEVLELVVEHDCHCTVIPVEADELEDEEEQQPWN